MQIVGRPHYSRSKLDNPRSLQVINVNAVAVTTPSPGKVDSFIITILSLVRQIQFRLLLTIMQF